LLDENGRRFMFDVHPDGELAPRDVVARGIAAAMARQGGRPVLLDATALGRDTLEHRFPTISRVTAAHGLDWATEPIPVTPAAHYWMGGIRTDLVGRTSLPGLFAVGEAACTGVHGANRLASNSLLESLVFAWRAVDALDEPWEAIAVSPTEISDELAGAEPFDRAELQQLMWQYVGVERSLTGLETAAATLARWGVDDTSVTAGEDRNLLDLARVIVRAAIVREESRGAHDRTDFPETSPAFARSFEWAVPALVRERVAQ
ncbi:MAG TPA: FAD-binding protein, partial [Pseudolysinimonas sp.]|nr:FAD-binding protein [Pseudolysinimonas sp.]